MEMTNNNDASRLEKMAEEVTNPGLKSRFVYHHRPGLAADIKPRSPSCFDWQSGPVGLEYGIMYNVSSLVHVRQSVAARLEHSNHPHLRGRGHEDGAKRKEVRRGGDVHHQWQIRCEPDFIFSSLVSRLSSLISRWVRFMLFAILFGNPPLSVAHVSWGGLTGLLSAVTKITRLRLDILLV